MNTQKYITRFRSVFNNMTAEMLLIIIVVVFLLWLYNPLILSPGVPTGGDEIFYAWMSDESRRRTIEFHNPWIGGPTEYYLYLWYDLIVNNFFSSVFKEKFPIFVVIFFSVVASLSFFKISCYLLREAKIEFTYFTKSVVLFMALLFVFSSSTGSILEGSFNPYILGLGGSIGFLVVIVPPVWSLIAFSALKTNNLREKIFLYIFLHVFSLLSLYNPAGYLLVMFLYILWLLSLFISIRVNHSGSIVSIDYLLLVTNMFLYSLYAVLPTYIALKLNGLGHLEFYFSSSLEERLFSFSSNFLQSILHTTGSLEIPFVGRISSTALFPISLTLVLFFSVSLLYLKNLFLTKNLSVNVLFLYLVFSFLFGTFISTGGLFPYSGLSKLYFLLFSLAQGELSKPHKFDGLFYFSYMLLCTIGLVIFVTKLRLHLIGGRVVKLFVFFVTLSTIFLLLSETFQELNLNFYESSYQLYSPFMVPNDLLTINKLFKNKTEVRVLVLPTSFEWSWKPAGKASGFINQYPYEILWNLPFPSLPFNYYEWPSILGKGENSQETILALLKTFDVNFVIISKELVRGIESESSYGWTINATHSVEQTLKDNGFLVYSGKDYDVYYLKVNYAQPVSLAYHKESTLSGCTEAFLSDVYSFYHNNTHIVLPSAMYVSNVLKSNEFSKVKVKSSEFLAGAIVVIDVNVSNNLLDKTLVLHVGDTYNPAFLNIAFYKNKISFLSSFPTLSNASIIFVPIKNSNITILRLYLPSVAWVAMLLLNVLYLFLPIFLVFIFKIK